LAQVFVSGSSCFSLALVLGAPPHTYAMAAAPAAATLSTSGDVPAQTDSKSMVLSKPDVSHSDKNYDVFMILASEQSGRAGRLRAALEEQNITVFLPAITPSMSGSAEAKLMAENAQSSRNGLVLLSQEFLNSIHKGSVGDVCCSLFNVSKRIPVVHVAAMEEQLLDPDRWGWNAVFAHLSGVTVWNLSYNMDGKEWSDTIQSLAAALKPAGPTSASLQSPAVADVPAPMSGSSDLRFKSAGWMDKSKNKDFRIKQYDAFLSHNWGLDSEGRDNHNRIQHIARYLRRNGLEVFLDVWEMGRYDSIDEAMVEGMKNSSLCVVFITQTYVDKIHKSGHWDNCVAEYNLAKKVPNMLPVVMEPALKSPNAWGWNAVNAQLASKLYIDMSWDSPSIWLTACTLGWHSQQQRWSCACYALYERIRQDTGKIGTPSLVVNKPPPAAPHPDRILVFGTALVAGSIIATLLSVSAIANFTFRNVVGFRMLADFLLAASFHFFMQWSFMLARVPPDFEFRMSKLAKIQVFASAIRCISSVLNFVADLRRWSEDDMMEESASILDAVGLNLNFIANVAAVVDVFVISNKAPWGFDGQRPAAFSNIPCWSAVCLLLGSIFFVAPEFLFVPEGGTDEIFLCGSCLYTLAAILILYWAALSPTMVRKYYHGLHAAHAPEDEVGLRAPCELCGEL